MRVALAFFLATTAAAQDVQLTAIPSVIAPGVISTPAEEFKATVSPDGLTLLYVLTDHQFRHMTVVESHRRSLSAEWETPEVAAFSGIWRDGDPAFAPDGKRLLFISNRGGHGVYEIWSVPRATDGRWGEPTLVQRSDTMVFAPSLTSTGVLYFSRGSHIYRVPRGGREEMLPFEGGDPAITADESAIVFDNNGDLFVSCRTAKGWGTPRKFGPPVDSPDDEGDPWISADGRTMYFYSKRSTPAADRTQRPIRPTYAQVLSEVTSDIYNGTRNLYMVALPEKNDRSYYCSYDERRNDP
jgi:Tol biopolymer transport system component